MKTREPTFSWRRSGALAIAGILSAALASAEGFSESQWHADVASARILAENDAPAAYAQAQRLLEQLPPAATPADRALGLNLVSRTELYLAMIDEAGRHAEEALDIATRNGDRVGEAEAELNLNQINVNRGRMDVLAAETSSALQALEGVQRPELLGEALLFKSLQYFRVGRVEDSVTLAMHSLEIARQNGDPRALTYAYQAVAFNFQINSRFAEARDNYLLMREQAVAAHSAYLEAGSLLGLGDALANLGDARSGEAMIRQAVDLYKKVGNPFSSNIALFSLANMVRLRGHPEQALAILTEVIERYDQHPNPIALWYSLNARSADYQSLHRMTDAAADANRAYEIAKKVGYPLYLGGSAKRLSAIAAARGEYQRSYELRAEADRMAEQEAHGLASDRMVELAQRFQEESKQRKIEELTRRSEQQAAQLLQRELQQRLLATLLAALVLALAGAALFVVLQRRTQRRLEDLNAQLQRSEKDIRTLNEGLEAGVEAATMDSRQQARYLQTLIDMLPMWAWFKDTRSRYLVVNQARAQALGHAAGDVVGRTDIELIAGDAGHDEEREDAEVVGSRTRLTSERRVRFHGGGAWMEVYKAPVIDDDGTVLGTVGVARDIGERRAAEEAREAALYEATQLARQRSDFLARMSHELRTPLNGILGFAQLLRRDEELKPAHERGVRIIEESGRHLLALITDVLDLARIDADKLDLVQSEVNLGSLLNIVCDIVRVKAEEKGLQFRFEASPALPRNVRVDERRLRQVLLNLLSNSVKFTDRGSVSLKVDLASGGDTSGTAETGVWIRFDVADTGIGLSDAQRKRLFQPFEQLADAERREGGTGLGLAISRQLIRLMGGDILVRSHPGEGTVFWFDIRLPVVSIDSAEGPRSGRPIGYKGHRRMILVADDVIENRLMLVDGLQGLGFVVVEAEDGQRAIETAVGIDPDLIIMDLMMPVLDGFEAILRLRRIPSFERLPIIAASASATAEIEARCRQAGADGFIGKPIEWALLLEAIGALLRLQWVYSDAQQRISIDL